ncbi:Trk system potassium transporter TrkA [Hirschia maritima]|uniref:Trk system potassium transporter TrkA n=1 Tax=Hirschia maritima TaxID=1121961 RepID=UPI0003775FA7|nr:Trk system potassium transporter TrkA [Hirschia maritima]
MRIIICGAGRVGQGIAERLSIDHDVTMIDDDANLLDQVGTRFDVRTTLGHAAHPQTLQDAGAENAEMIIAVTHMDEINMVTCQVAHSLFKITTKIARIRTQAYTKTAYSDLFTRDHIPVDMHISPEAEVSESILQGLSTPGAFLSADMGIMNQNESGVVKLLGVEITDKDSTLHGRRLEDIYALCPDCNAQIVGIGRDKNLFVPKEDHKLELNDRVYWIIPTDKIEHMFDILGISENHSRHVVVVGGGHIGLNVAKQLEAPTKKNGRNKHNVKVRLIEREADKANKAAEFLERAIVLHGDGLDPNLLEEAGVSDSDLVVGLTNDDKTNLLLGALAKKIGAKKVISLVNEADLANIKSNVGIDVLIDPRSITVSKILLKLRQGRLSNLKTLENGAAEVVEGVVKETAPLVGMTLTPEELPEGISAGAIIRDGSPIELSNKVKVHDTVILFAEKEMSRKVDLLFRVKLDYY